MDNILPLTINLGYVESSRFHTFCFGYSGPLAATRPLARKNMPKIILHLKKTIEEYRVEMAQNCFDSWPPDAFFDWLALQDVDSIGSEGFRFFEERGWYLLCPATKTPGYTVENVAAFMCDSDDEDEVCGYLEWRGTGKTYTTRDSEDA